MYLKFAYLAEALTVLTDRFPEWDGTSTPHTNGSETLVHVANQTIQRVKWNADPSKAYDEDGNPDLTPYPVTGFRVDLDIQDEGTEYDLYKLPIPSNPAHTF